MYLPLCQQFPSYIRQSRIWHADCPSSGVQHFPGEQNWQRVSVKVRGTPDQETETRKGVQP